MCWKCGKNITEDVIGRTSVCSFCNADLRCCRNCRHYSKSHSKECKENIDEEIFDKEKANFCDFFQVKKDFGNNDKSLDDVKSAREKFASLFGD